MGLSHDIMEEFKYSWLSAYELVTEDGKKYPPKYVIVVAAHTGNGVEISIDGFNAVKLL